MMEFHRMHLIWWWRGGGDVFKWYYIYDELDKQTFNRYSWKLVSFDARENMSEIYQSLPIIQNNY